MSNTSEDAQLDLLKRALPEDVRFICERLHQAGQTGWAVGGSVRDVIRGAPASDWDVATDALPEKVVTLFKRVIPTGLKHGTVTVLLKGQAYEVLRYG